MNKPNWFESATAVLNAPQNDERAVLAEGELWRVLLRLEELQPLPWQRVTISLPDRQVAPFHYAPAEIAALRVTPDRPRTRPLRERAARAQGAS